MPGYGAALANSVLDAANNTAPTVSYLGFVNLNTADPGTTGASEATSTRQACAWNAASARTKTNSSALTFTGQSGVTACTHFSTWTLVSAGVYGISGALGSSVTATTITVAAGALTISA
jgi:hypothetical protein